MTFSKLRDLVNNYDRSKWSPTRLNISFGCECGCGGDEYTEERWDAEEEYANDSIKGVKDFCIKYGIHYDGVE